MTSNTAVDTRRPLRLSLGRPLSFAAQTGRAAVLAAAGTAAVYMAGHASGVSLAVQMMPGVPALPLSLAMVITTSVLAAIAGSFAYQLTRRFTRGSRVFRTVATIALLLSLAGPLALGNDVATKATLILMHVVAAVVIVFALERSAA